MEKKMVRVRVDPKFVPIKECISKAIFSWGMSSEGRKAARTSRLNYEYEPKQLVRLLLDKRALEMTEILQKNALDRNKKLTFQQIANEALLYASKRPDIQGNLFQEGRYA